MPKAILIIVAESRIIPKPKSAYKSTSRLIPIVLHSADNNNIKTPAIKFPIATGISALKRLKPKNTAKIVPAYTPVIGSGIATKTETVMAFKKFSLFTLFLCLRVLSANALSAFFSK